MSLDLEHRLRRYGDAFEHAVAATEITPFRAARRSVPRQRRGRWLVAAAILVGVITAAVLALPRADNGPRVVAPSGQPELTHYRNDEKGFAIDYPTSWRRSAGALMPDNDDATELVSIGTYDLPTGSTTCPTGPQNALDALPADGALVSVQERTDFMFAPARATYPPADPIAASDQPGLCMVGSSYEHWVVTFTDQNRSVRVLVAFGSEASAATKDSAWQAINSLDLDLPAASAIPNHVTRSLYDMQAMGASEVARLPDGPYATALREGDNICLDLRPSGAPSGPRFCSIPANAPWPQPVIASIVTLDGVNYVIGVAAADTVTRVEVNGAAAPLSARQVFPTLRFFAVPISDIATVTATTRDRIVTITPTSS
jgi:hypothetical protein